MGRSESSATVTATSSSLAKASPPTTSAPSSSPPPSLEEQVATEMSLPMENIQTYDREIDYANKLVLAPMVRSGSLPMRLLALYYGAGLVWSPEIVDKAIIGATRKVDSVTGVITYSKKGNTPIFTCHPVEKPYLIFQIGSSDPELAVQAAKTVQQDVSGFDLNCGCPKPFSVHSGMGAALLSTPDLLLDILRGLVTKTSLPVSCKIRLLPDQPSTLLLAARILRTGIRNLTVHCRTRDMRSSSAAIWDRLGDIVRLGKQRSINVTCNGDGEGWSNWQMIRERTDVTSVMIARAAESNPSIFLPTGPISTCEKLIPEVFLPVCAYLEHHYSNTKFLLYQFKPSSAPISHLTKAEKQRYSEGVAKAKTTEDALAFWGLGKDDVKATGKRFMERLNDALTRRLAGEDIPVPALASTVADEHLMGHHNIWQERSDAETKGTNVDQGAAEGEDVITREIIDDEEAAMNDA